VIVGKHGETLVVDWGLAQPPHLPSHFPVFSGVWLVFQSLFPCATH
jgi:hypothetical protein